MKNNNQPLKIWYIELELVIFKKNSLEEQFNILLSGKFGWINLGLKHVTIITDLRCFEKLRPVSFG